MKNKRKSPNGLLSPILNEIWDRISQEEISTSVSQNIKTLQQIWNKRNDSKDNILTSFNETKPALAACWINDRINETHLQNIISRIAPNKLITAKNIPSLMNIESGSNWPVTTYQEVIKAITTGQVIFFFEGEKHGLAVTVIEIPEQEFDKPQNIPTVEDPSIVFTNTIESEDRIIKWMKRIFFIILLSSLSVIIWATVMTYQAPPPFPSKIISTNGQVIMTRTQIEAGKAGFQESDLMDYGSVYGNGSYFGEDFTAQLLHQWAIKTLDNYALQTYTHPYHQLSSTQRMLTRKKIQDLLHHPKWTGQTVVVPDYEARAMTSLLHSTAASLLVTDRPKGYTGAPSLNAPTSIATATFLLYTAWTAVVHRPGLDYSYTNNWPYDPLVGNYPTAPTFLWTWISLILLLTGVGVTIYFYLVHISYPLENKEEISLSKFRKLTPSQRKTGKFFISVAILVFIQIGAGMLSAHYYADRSGFFGINILNILPFNVLKAIHIQTAIFWIAISWMGAGIFLAPFISGKEPKHQGLLVDILFVTMWLVGLSTLFGLYAGIKGWLPGNSWFWFGNQGLSYLQLGRFDQLTLFFSLILWVFIIGRALWPALKKQKGLSSLEHLLFYSGVSIAGMYVFGMFPVTWIMTSFTLTDFWRWWVVHLWVEGAFTFFSIIVTAYLLVVFGILPRKTADRAVWFELILLFLGGILSLGHHMYWIGEPWIWISLGSMFSFLEVIPLLMMIIEAIKHSRALKIQQKFYHRVAFLYVSGAGIWNFYGAGVLGELTNSPSINYYEHGTFLTLAHAHTSMFGAFGLLGFGLIYFVLRYFVGEKPWFERPAIWSFWLYNLGMILWLVLHFWPIGYAQLAAVHTHSYVYARSLSFYNTTLIWQWLRMPGDILFATGAAWMSWDIIKKVRSTPKTN